MRRRRTPAKHAPHAVPAARTAAGRSGADPEPGGPGKARSKGRSLQGDVQLAWARDRDGAKVHAARLAPADRRGRAPFTCLGCGEELIPHLGRVRARHFAHRPGSSCPLTAPESALHLDAKERLLALCADAFAGRRQVTLLLRCPGCRRPEPRDLAALGDAAEEEGAVGSLRADVLVRRGGTPALAIEVLVTHAVEPEKEAALAAAGVPAVEVDAREEWEREDERGTAVSCARCLGFPPCAACAARTRADQDRARGGEAAEIAELEAYRARGLLGPRSAGPASARAPPTRTGAGDPEAPLSGAERYDLEERFRCPECGGTTISFGNRIARHACGGAAPRPIAWRGYDGSLILLSWWSRDRG
jgi:hypothetical protein